MALSLDGKVALISGTGSGIGRAGAQHFAAAGAMVVGCDLDATGNAETARLVADAGGTMRSVAPVDLGDYLQCQAWIEHAVQEFGRVDVLWNNASACEFATIEAMTVERWEFSVRNELTLVFLATKAAWQQLKGGGLIINTASVAGYGGGPGGIAHSATKAAVLGMTHVMAAEGGPVGIRAVSISPGAIQTPGSAEQLSIPGAQDALLQQSLLPRLGQPTDIARAAVFLASDDAAFVTGVALPVDGGFLIR